METYYFYLPFGLSGVTRYYVEIIEEAIKNNGYEIKHVKSRKDIPRHANVLTIDPKLSVLAFMFCSPKQLITWYQGVSPEEMLVFHQKSWTKHLRKSLYRVIEKISLNKSTLNIFVSQAMLRHFEKQYKYTKDNYVVMPCFGNELDESAFNDERYKKPRFLYSGSLLPWQCVERTIKLFKKIKEALPEATLSILTPSQDEAKELLRRNAVVGEVDFVQPDKLQEYIKGFKYGFLLRDDMIMNNVATPTKISNYMGAGIIPVFSNVINDYKTIVAANNPFVVALEDDTQAVEQIVQFEKQTIDAEAIKQCYSKIFDTYWNRKSYVDELTRRISSL